MINKHHFLVFGTSHDVGAGRSQVQVQESGGSNCLKLKNIKLDCREIDCRALALTKYHTVTTKGASTICADCNSP